MKIITLSGLDGSGKSTQIKLLQKYLESKKFQVFYFHVVSFSLAQKINAFKKRYCLICKLRQKCRIDQEKSVTKSFGFGIFLRKVCLRIDLWRFKLLCNKLRNKGYDYILSDRYFYDTLVNIEYLSGRRQISPKELLFPNLAIYLKANPELIISRERKPDQGIEYLKKKKMIYDKRATEWHIQIVNGNSTPETVFKEIINLMEKS